MTKEVTVTVTVSPWELYAGYLHEAGADEQRKGEALGPDGGDRTLVHFAMAGALYCAAGAAMRVARHDIEQRTKVVAP